MVRSKPWPSHKPWPSSLQGMSNVQVTCCPCPEHPLIKGRALPRSWFDPLQILSEDNMQEPNKNLAVRLSKRCRCHSLEQLPHLNHATKDLGPPDLLTTFSPKTSTQPTSSLATLEEKRSNDQTRQCIKKQRLPFANKDTCSQNYSFQ